VNAVDKSPGPLSLRRALGLWQVSLAGIGVILGAGVYALVGPAAAQAGNALWLSFLLAGLTAGLTAYAYARLGRLVPRNAPEFQYTALAFGPTVGFIAGWLMLAADVLATGAVALGFAGYLRHLAGTPLTANALALLAAVGVILYSGIGQSVAVAIALTAVEAIGLIFVIIVGMPFWAVTDYLVMPRGVLGVSTAAALIFFAYLGFDELGNLAEEMRHPERDLPRSLFISIVATTTMSSSPSRRSPRWAGQDWRARMHPWRWSPAGCSACEPTSA
jgi:APA family basic amino acid/polyamine antiporter